MKAAYDDLIKAFNEKSNNVYFELENNVGYIRKGIDSTLEFNEVLNKTDWTPPHEYKIIDPIDFIFPVNGKFITEKQETLNALKKQEDSNFFLLDLITPSKNFLFRDNYDFVFTDLSFVVGLKLYDDFETYKQQYSGSFGHYNGIIIKKCIGTIHLPKDANKETIYHECSHAVFNFFRHYFDKKTLVSLFESTDDLKQPFFKRLFRKVNKKSYLEEIFIHLIGNLIIETNNLL